MLRYSFVHLIDFSFVVTVNIFYASIKHFCFVSTSGYEICDTQKISANFFRYFHYYLEVGKIVGSGRIVVVGFSRLKCRF